MDAGASAGIVLAIIVVLVLIYINYSLIIVHQAEGMVIERFGKFQRVLKSGLNWITPFVDTPRSFNWTRTSLLPSGAIEDTRTTDSRIDLRESVFNFMRQEVYTKDTVLVTVNALMYYRIFDIKKAVYEVDDLESALSNTAQTQLKEVFGNMSFSEALQSQAAINKHLGAEFAKLFYAWGISVERMELLELTPRGNISDSMKKQMVAERQRRGEFIRSEGAKSAMRLTAEGNKMVSVNMGLAEQEATKKRSEGEAGAKIELAQAESNALETVAQALKTDGTAQSQYMLSQRYLDMFRSMNANVDNKNIYLPYEVFNISGLVGTLPDSFGLNSSFSAAGVPENAGGDDDEFDDLS